MMAKQRIEASSKNVDKTGQLLGSLDEPHNVLTAENSVAYKDNLAYVSGTGKNEPSTVKRRPNKMTGSLSRTGSAGE